MPKGPKGEKRPADVIGNAVKSMRILTGDEPKDVPRKEAAAAAGRKGGMKGGTNRAAKLTPEERAEAAKLAAQARWRKKD